jgi:hypothetical protein
VVRLNREIADGIVDVLTAQDTNGELSLFGPREIAAMTPETRERFNALHAAFPPDERQPFEDAGKRPAYEDALSIKYADESARAIMDGTAEELSAMTPADFAQLDERCQLEVLTYLRCVKVEPPSGWRIPAYEEPRGL